MNDTTLKANQLMSWFSEHWSTRQIGLTLAYPGEQETQQAKADEAIEKKLQALDTNMHALVPYSTIWSMKACFGNSLPLPSEQKKIWDLLKLHERLFQVGGGRGKAIVILNPMPIEEEIETVALIDPDDTVALIKALQNKLKEDQLDQGVIEEKLEDQNKQIERLQGQVANNHRTSWA